MLCWKVSVCELMMGVMAGLQGHQMSLMCHQGPPVRTTMLCVVIGPKLQ